MRHQLGIIKTGLKESVKEKIKDGGFMSLFGVKINPNPFFGLFVLIYYYYLNLKIYGN